MILSAEPRRPERVHDWPHAWKLALATVCFGAFMGQLDASIVTLAYRPLQKQFHAGAAAVQWVSLAYLLALIALLVPIGRHSDQKGRKLSYLRGFVVFTLGSAACGLAPDLAVLIVARVAEGVGAALLQANSVALVTRVVPRGRLRSALGVQAGAQALGLALGPTAGGLIVSTIGWRWVFAVNVPVGVLALLAATLFLPRTTEFARSGSLDPTGSLLLGGTAAALLLALSAAGGLSLPVGLIAALSGGAVLGVVALAHHQRSVPNPVLTPAVVAIPGVRGGLTTAMFCYLTLFGPLVLIPEILDPQGVSSLVAGLVLTALPAGFALAATLGGGVLPRRWDDRRRGTVGAGLASAALAAGLVLPIDPGWMVLVLGALGLGLGVLTPANNASIMRAVPAGDTASAGAMLSVSRGMGTALGIAAVTLALHTGGARLALGALLTSALLAAATAWTTGIPKPGHPGRIMPTRAV